MKERQPGQIKYDTNKSVRSKIDSILHDCVVMFANVGTNTPLDVGTKEDAKRIEKENMEIQGSVYRKLSITLSFN